MADKNKSGDFYTRPEKVGAWTGFKQFFWNSETKQCMGRTGSSWGMFVHYHHHHSAIMQVDIFDNFP
jgi:sodium/potassium-transporting ATPase subunit beta